MVCERWSVTSCERSCMTKWCERWCVADGVSKMVCVTELCVKNGVRQSGVSKMVCDKAVCERWCVTKLCVKDGVGQRWCV